MHAVYTNEMGQRVKLPRNPDDWGGCAGDDCPMNDWEVNQIAAGLPVVQWEPVSVPVPPEVVDETPVAISYEVTIQGRRYIENHQYVRIQRLVLGDGGKVFYNGKPVLRLKSQADPSHADVYGTKRNRWVGD